MGHDEVYPLRDGVQEELEDEAPSKEGICLSCYVASRLSQTAITKNQENAGTSAVYTNSLRKDERLHC